MSFEETGSATPGASRQASEETVETLYLLGAEDRIVGVSGYAVRPPRVRREKPRVSAFTSADIPKILALAPDLVLAFSDLQAGIVADLARAPGDIRYCKHHAEESTGKGTYAERKATSALNRRPG